MADCMVITMEQWDQLVRAIGWMLAVAAGIGWLASFDLGRWEWRVRRHLRRRRLSRIRAAKAVRHV